MPLNKEPMFSSEYQEVRRSVIEKLEESEPKEAFSFIQPILAYPNEINDLVLKDALELFEKIALMLGEETLGKSLLNVLEDLNDTQALFSLSYMLYEHKLHGIAANLLNRANKIKPLDIHILPEFVYNLEEMMLYEDVCEIFSKAKPLLDSSELCRYLLAINSLMSGNLEKPFEIYKTLQLILDENVQEMVGYLKCMLDRAEVLKGSRSLDAKDLRGWHMVLNGTILLHRSPWGINSGMNGRYAFMTDSYSLCQHGIKRVKEVLKELTIEVPYIIALPDHSSQILATATSQILEKPLKIWDIENDNGPGLIVSYDLADIESIELYQQLHLHRPGQILWTHASCWTRPFPFSPDINTFLYQEKASELSGGVLMIDPETKEPSFSEPNNSPVKEIALKMIEAENDSGNVDDLEDLLSLVNAIININGETSKPGMFRTRDYRPIQRLGSPVKSSYFNIM